MHDQCFLFIGEKRSKTVINYGWTWDHARLAGSRLTEVLEDCGLSRLGPPYGHYYEVVKQLLENLRQKSLLLRLSNDGVIPLLGWLSCLEFLGFCCKCV